MNINVSVCNINKCSEKRSSASLVLRMELLEIERRELGIFIDMASMILMIL